MSEARFKDWNHRTNTGRVVYSRKTHFFTGRSILQILERTPTPTQGSLEYFYYFACQQILQVKLGSDPLRWAVRSVLEFDKQPLKERKKHNAYRAFIMAEWGAEFKKQWVEFVKKQINLLKNLLDPDALGFIIEEIETMEED